MDIELRIVEYGYNSNIPFKSTNFIDSFVCLNLFFHNNMATANGMVFCNIPIVIFFT
jgi:hypothetical protein